jgi:hypothetical protein
LRRNQFCFHSGPNADRCFSFHGDVIITSTHRADKAIDRIVDLLAAA